MSAQQFIAALTEAHAIVLAHRSGADTVPQIALRTGLRVSDCSHWVRVLQLKVVEGRPIYTQEKLTFEI